MKQQLSAGPLGPVAGSRVLVTGGDGLIGAQVVRLLSELGADVTSFDQNAQEATSAGYPPDCSRLTGSVTDRDAVQKAVAGHDAVVHLAGLAGLDRGSPEDIYAANALGTFVVMEAAARAGVVKLVYASSINASGLPLNSHPVLPTRYPFDEDQPIDITDAYSLSKHANEAAARALSRRNGLALTGLRYPLVRDITAAGGTAFARHIRRALYDDPRRQACEGWTYLDVRDAAAATLAALTHDTPAAPAVLVAAPRTYLRQQTEDALRRFAPTVPREFVPDRVVPVRLDRAESLLEFHATVFLEDLDPDLLADLDELTA